MESDPVEGTSFEELPIKEKKKMVNLELANIDDVNENVFEVTLTRFAPG